MRQFEHNTLGVILHISRFGDNESIIEHGRSSKLNVVVRLHLSHLGSHGTHDVTAHPSSLLRTLLLNGFSHGVWVGLATLDSGVETYAVIDIAEQELPCATIVAEDTHHATFAER